MSPDSADALVEDTIDSATPLEMGLVRQRPRLFLTPARLAFLRAAVAQEPYAGFFRQVRAFADSRMGPAVPDWTRGDTRGHGCVLPHLALVFLLTGDARYRDRALAIARAARDLPSPGLACGHLLGGLATAYDWLHGSLAAGERRELADMLHEFGSRAFEDAGLFRAWTYNILTCNHLPVAMSGLIAAGSALYGERPGIGRWLQLNVEKARLMAGALGDDGASQEGIGYGQYYNEFFVKMLVLVRDLMGVDLFEECGYLRQLPLFYLYSSLSRDAWTPQASLINLGDGVRYNWYGPDSHLRVLAAAYRDPLAQWLADQHLAAGTAAITGSFLNLTHYDAAVPARGPEGLPPSHRFADKDMVLQRSGWGSGEAFLAFRCGPHFGHYALSRYTGEIGGGHMQANNGSVYLVAGSDYLLAGDGYFRKSTEYANTLRIDGRGQTGEGGDWFESLELRRERRGPRILAARLDGEFEHTIGDLAPAYPADLGIGRLLRKVLYLRPRTWVLVDEIEAAEPVAAEARFHSDYPFVAEGPGWLARGKVFVLRLTAHGTGAWTARTGTQTYLGTGGSVAAQGPVLSLESERRARSALVTVLEVLPASGPLPDPPTVRLAEGQAALAIAGAGSRGAFRIALFPRDPGDIGIAEPASEQGADRQ